MTTTKALFSATLLLVVIETPVWAQARPFVGRLVSREYSIETNCSTQKPPPQILGLGLNPLPKLPDCEYIFANGTTRTTKPSYSSFNVDFPATTPGGVMNPSGASATVEFSQPLTFRVSTNIGWSLSPPEGQTTGTHLANYSLEVEQFASDLGSCTGSNTSTNGSGSLLLDGSCSMRRAAGAWNPATQTARQVITAAVSFRFGSANGEYTVRIKAIYDFSALDVDHIEVLQTVQTSDNRVPLVAGKAALVRVFPASAPGSSEPVQIRLNIYRGDRLVQSQESGTIAISNGGVAPRDDLSRSANFLLPAALTGAGAIRFEPLIRTSGSYGLAKGLEIAFQNAPGWQDPFRAVQVDMCPLAGECATVRNLAEGFKLFSALAPATARDVSRSFATNDRSAQAFKQMYRLRSAIESQRNPASWPELYLATDGRDLGDNLVEADPIFGPGLKKLAYLSGDTAVTLPCVIGLNLGLTKAESNIVDPGLNPSLDSLLDAATPDFMTCDSTRPSWISAANAILLFDAYKARVPAPPAVEAFERTVITGTRGTIGDFGSVGTSITFDPLFRIQTTNPAIENSGDLCLRFFNKTEQVGLDQCFSAVNGEVFATAVALPTDTDRIALLASGNELGSISRSANAPVIQIATRPAAAPDRILNLTWTASDSDGDPLLYQVWASRDNGQTWNPLALDLTTPTILIDTARLAPATAVLLQIRASDGFNEAIETLGPITLDAKSALDAIAPIRMSDSRWNEGRLLQIPLNNSGSGTLRITAVESSRPSFSYAGPEIVVAAGQSGILPLLFTASEIGAVSASITLRTNDPARPAVVIPIEGSVFLQQGAVASLDVAALDFGPVSSNAERALRVTNRGNAPLALTAISVGITQVYRLTGANTALIAPGNFTEIAARCTPLSANYVSGTLTFSTNDAARPIIGVPLGCEGTTVALEIPTTIVDFGAVASGQVRSQTVVIRNTSSQPLTITGAVFTNAQFRLATPRVPFAIAAASSVNLDIQFAPVVGGVATGTLSLNTDNPAISGQIALRGTGTGSTQINGRLAIDPNQLTFGEVTVNQSKTLLLTFRNTGTGQLTVTAIASNNPVFVVSGVTLPLAIVPGSSVDVQVRFSPTSTTASNSVLTISSDSVTGSDVFLSMTGTGLAIQATTLSNLSAPLRQEWTTRASLVSLGPDEANLRFVRYDNAGTQSSDTGVTIPAGAQFLPEIDSGSGWTQIRVAKGLVEGYLQFSGQQGQTFDVVPYSPAIDTRFIMTGLERGSDILLGSLVSETNTVALNLVTNNGAVVGNQSLNLGPRASITQKVEQLFSSVPQGFQGYLTISATQPLQATRTNNGGTAMEVLPAQATPANAARNVVLYAPRIQAGNGWLARLQVVNPTDREARVTIRSASSAGVSIGTPIVEIIPAGRAYWREFTQMFNLDGNISWNASLTVESNVAGVVAEVSYGNSFARAAYAFTETPTKRALIPVNTSATTLYILNPNPTPAGVSVQNLLEGGSYGTGRRITIPAGGYYGGPSGLTASPALRIESDLPVVTQAAITSEQVVDFGILPARNLDGGSTVTPPAGTSPRLQVDPPALDFGSIVIGQSRTLSLSIRNGGTAALTVLSITSSSVRYTVEGTLPLTITPGSTQQVQVRYTPSTPPDTQTATLTVTSNDTLTGPITIRLTGAGTATETPRVRIDVSPAALEYGDVNSGQIKDLPLLIRNLGTDPLTINSVTISNSRFQLVSASFPLTVGASGLATIQVRFAPPAAGSQTGILVISSNDNANPTVSIALRGNGVGVAASPKIAVSVTMLELGLVRLGQQNEQTFEIRNTGVAPLVIQSMTLDNTSYSVGPVAPFTLAPNAIADIAIIFKPKDAGNQPANLRILSNDPVNGIVLIPITGSGQQ